MALPVPPVTWPTEFRESGPEEDPAIVLTAGVRIGGVPFRLTALRMRAGLRTPDFLERVPAGIYDAAMGGMLDDIEDLAGSLAVERVALNGACYLMWIVPAAGNEEG